MVMCVDCGTFVEARDEAERTVPIQEACPNCGGTVFKDTDTGQVTTTEPE